MEKNAIIVAGGKGTRMQSTIAKQFLVLDNKPVLMHTIEAFARFDHTMNIILALPEHQFPYWNDLCLSYPFNVHHTLVAGGETRFHSVKNALAKVNNGLVAIHDGVRPLVSQKTISDCFDLAQKNGSAIPIIDMDESVRYVDEDGNKAMNRDQVKKVQTPQVFQSNEIKLAYEQEFKATFTDDASVFEAMGHKVFLTEGNRENIKITQPEDMEIAELLLKRMAAT